MWIASKYGFYSIIQKDDGFHVRGRLKGDLENLKEHSGLDCEVLKWDTADYRYRMIVPADKIAGVFTTLLDSIDYSNFKSQIGRTEDQREKLGAYHEIWGIMEAMQR